MSESNIATKGGKPSDTSDGKVNPPRLEDFFQTADLGKDPLTVEEMFKAGVHFGHKKSRRNPRMDEFIYTYRDSVAIIDLKKSLDLLEEALEVIRGLAREGKPLLFVGTKKHARLLTLSAAKRVGQPFVVDRWLGGTFTNFDVIKKRVQYLEELKHKIEAGELTGYTKFEQMKKMEEAEKLERKMGGLSGMDKLPGALFVVDATQDNGAIREAKAVGVPVIAFTDTNDDPTAVDYNIPANNDALSSLKLLLGQVCRAYEDGATGETREV